MLADETLAALTERARRHGSRIAIICDERRMTFIELDDRVGRLARRLYERGVRRGDVVSLYGPVGWEWVVIYHAVLRLGGVINPVNALLTADEVGFILRDCNARLIFAEEAKLHLLRSAGVLPDGIDEIPFERIAVLTHDGDGLAPANGDPSDLSTICYTSGTTGRPKGAMLSHRSVLMNAGLTALMHGRSNEDIIVTALPLAHVYGNVVMNSALIVGATLVLLPAFTPECAISAVADHRATRFEGVPTMYYRLLGSAALAEADISSLRLCTVGGQTMPVEKMVAVEQKFGCPLIELWGMSEIGGLGTTFPWTGPRTLGSIGIALPGVEVRTVGHTGLKCAAGKEGELQIRGPIVMQGYLNNAEATREVLSEDGWLSTGDIARIDDAGQVFVVDRSKDLIITSGNNVYPAEIERVIAALPGVAMAAVGRDPHPDKGEVPHAFVVCETGVVLSSEAVIDHCRRLLAPYKIPRAVTFVDDLPKTSTGKIARRLLPSV